MNEAQQIVICSLALGIYYLGFYSVKWNNELSPKDFIPVFGGFFIIVVIGALVLNFVTLLIKSF